MRDENGRCRLSGPGCHSSGPGTSYLTAGSGNENGCGVVFALSSQAAGSTVPVEVAGKPELREKAKEEQSIER